MNELNLELSSIISQRKDKYYLQLAKKLNDPQTNAKTYWTILKMFFNGRKIPIIPSLLIEGKLVSDFKEKANMFNEFFSRQCTPLNNVQVNIILSLMRDSPPSFLIIKIS